MEKFNIFLRAGDVLKLKLIFAKLHHAVYFHPKILHFTTNSQAMS
jgi:hypothetical protein